MKWAVRKTQHVVFRWHAEDPECLDSWACICGFFDTQPEAFTYALTQARKEAGGHAGSSKQIVTE